MGLVKLRVLDDRFQADLWAETLKGQNIPYVLRTYQDTAYDGIYVSQKGFGAIFVEEEDLARASEVDRDLSGKGGMAYPDPAWLARRIDHTLLDPAAGPGELERHLEDCLEMNAAAACVSPWMTSRAAQALSGSQVAVCTVVGFPLGTEEGEGKAESAARLAGLGARELDVVINRGLAAHDMNRAVDEIAVVVERVKPALVKVIVETSEMGPELAGKTADALRGSGAAFLKTGTGYFGPATAEDVKLLLEGCQGEMEVKAAGGVKDVGQALALLDAGAARLGSSSGLEIFRQAQKMWEEGR